MRQQRAYPSARRRETAILVLGGECDPGLARSVVAGAAAMGVPSVACDYHGGYSHHWFFGPFPYMAAQINTDTTYECLVADQALSRVAMPLVDGKANAWVVVIANDPARARHMLRELDGGGARAPVLLAVTAAGGLVVDRAPSPAVAQRRLESAGDAGIAAGPSEMAIQAAGLALNEILLGRERTGEDLAGPRMVGAYCLRWPLRVVELAGDDGLGGLIREISQPPGPAASFRGRPLVVVGAGALANWAVIPIALDGGARVRLYDGDPVVAAHNLNRQVLLARGVGRGTKVGVLAEELQAMDPDGTYEPVPAFVGEPRDLAELAAAEALVALPDNDAARAVCGDAALAASTTYATAGSSAVGAQAVLCRAGVSCYRCVAGRHEAAPEAAAEETAGVPSCRLVQEDSVVASNMVAAGLLVSELRESLAGRRTANVRFCGDSTQGNRLRRMVTPQGPCSHGAELRRAGFSGGRRA